MMSANRSTMTSAQLPFNPPSLADADRIRTLVAATGAMANDLSFANLYLLRNKYQTTVAVEDGVLYRHYSGGRLHGYAFPCGGRNAEAALRRIEDDAALRGRPLRFCLLTPADAAMLQELRPGRFLYAADDGDADYIYRRTDLEELPGTDYHRKRNHIARFTRQQPGWHFATLTSANAADALQVAYGWLNGADSEAPALAHELQAIEQALHHMDELGLCGGIIYIESQPVAMAIASAISPLAADVHYEKCLPGYRDAYPLINRELARVLSAPSINREEDLNQPGLRQAKQSYRPALLLSKQTATPC